MYLQIFDKSKKRKFIEKISYLGVSKIPYLLIKTGKEKIRAYSGSFSNDEVHKLFGLLRIEVVGLYLGKEAGESVRISLDGLHVLKEQISKNVIQVNEEQKKEWFFGKDILLNEDQGKCLKGVVAIKNGEDFIGTGKISADGLKVSSFLPKRRRVKN